MLHKMAFTSNFMSFFVCGMPFYGKRFPARQPPFSKPRALLTLIIYFALEISVHQRKKRRPKREGPFYGRIVYPCGKETSTTVTTKKHATHSATCNGYQNRGTVVLSVVYSFLYIFHQHLDFLPSVLLQPTRIGHSPWYT